MFQRSLGVAAAAAAAAEGAARSSSSSSSSRVALRQCLSSSSSSSSRASSSAVLVAPRGAAGEGCTVIGRSTAVLGGQQRRQLHGSSGSSLVRAAAAASLRGEGPGSSSSSSDGQRQRRWGRLFFSTEPALQNAANPPAPEAPIPPPAEDKGDGAPPEASPQVAKLSEEILSLNMLELGQLLKVLKHRLGLTDADLRGAAVAVPGAGGAAAGGDAAAEEEKPAEKEAFDLKLVSFDEKSKIKVIKEVRTISGLGLKEAKELVEGAPKIIKKEVKKEEAQKLLEKLKEVGAKVELV